MAAEPEPVAEPIAEPVAKPVAEPEAAPPPKATPAPVARRAPTEARTEPISDGKVSLRIVSDPPLASIAVEGRSLGPAPVVLRLEPGSFVEIRGSLDGFLATHRLHKVPETDGSYRVTLAPE